MKVATTRDELIVAVCSYVASRFDIDLHPESPNGDAEMEYREEHLAEAAKNYITALAERNT